MSRTADIDFRVVRLLDNATLAFCDGDTAKAISFYETIAKDHPNDAMVVMTNRILGDLYRIKGAVKEAKETMLHAFYYKPENYPFVREVDCPKMNYKYNISTAKADLCVAISQLYLSQRQYDSSVFFLEQADKEYLPYKECANGIYTYKSFLSTYFADTYLAMGDTTKAIARLLDFFMNQEANRALLTGKLKSIVLEKWTQEEINKEVRAGLKKMKFVDKGYNQFDIFFTLFGHTIKAYGYGSTRLCRKLYKNDKSLKILLTEGM